MLIGDRLASQPKAPPFTVTKDQMVADAVTTMAERNYGATIVVDDDERVVGILTERDVVRKIVDAGIDAKATPISEVMTSDPSVALETDEVESWMKTMSEKRFRRIPVVDDQHKIRAILTQTDLIAYAWPVLLAQTKEIAERDSRRRFYALLIGGGILIYALAMVILFSSLRS
ncbi:MAG: CBS domain-containing protein [Pseudomonadota bacterium]